MTNEEKLRLKFRRQYVLSPERIDSPFSCNIICLPNNYFLYTHIDLNVTEHNLSDVRLILLGDMFDFESPEKSNSDILHDIIAPDFDIVVNNTARYTGRFILIFIIKDQIRLIHDLTATRKIYYYKSDKGIWCSSQIHLLANLNQLEKTKDESKNNFYTSHVYRLLNYSNIGNITAYDDIFQLLPNHYIDISTFQIARYWIKKPDENLTLNQTIQICATMLKGYINAISHRYNIMLPVTAGKDSRTLLAATKDICDKVYFYINKEYCLNEKSNDIYIPTQLFRKLNLDFHILDPYIEIDKDFEEVYYSNNPDASPYYLPHIYNYYKNFPDKVNLPGNLVASCYDMYGKDDSNFTAETLAKLNWVRDYNFAIEYYQSWLDGCKDFCKQHNLHLSLLFYWEERLANWGTQLHADKDIAQEDIIPYNSRLLNHYFLSVKPELIDRPYYLFFIKIMRLLWPEVLKVTINPSFKNLFVKLLYRTRILDPIRKLFLWKLILRKQK
jgi:hypothetical protein